jgi:potassium-dependent mechanosensitive channel
MKRQAWWALVAWAALSTAAFGQPPGPSSTPSATASPAASSTPATLRMGELTGELDATREQITRIDAEVQASESSDVLAAKLPALAAEIRRQTADNQRLLQANPSLENLRLAHLQWLALRRELPAWAEALTAHLVRLDGQVLRLQELRGRWEANRAELQSGSAPSSLLQRVHDLLNSADEVLQRVQKRRVQVLDLQAQVSALQSEAQAGTEELDRARKVAVDRILTQDSPPLWSRAAFRAHNGDLLEDQSHSLAHQSAALASYVANQPGRLCLQLWLLACLSQWLRWVKGKVAPWVAQDRRLLVLQSPFSAALFLTVLFTRQIHPDGPPLLTALWVGAALWPVSSWLAGFVQPALLRLVVALFCLDQVRALASAVPVLARVVFLLELAFAGCFLALYLRSKATLAWLLGLAGAALLIALAAGVGGFMEFSYLVGQAAIHSGYLAVMLYALLEVVDGLFSFATLVRPLQLLAVTRRHRELLRARFRLGIGLLLTVAWLLATLELFTVRTGLLRWLTRVFAAELRVGAIGLSLGDVCAFLLVIWGAFQLSRLIRFVLEEDVYPRVQLGAGLPYAISTVLHYGVLLIGFMVAAAAAGVEAGRFAVLGGAFGVGLGFGLQNIVNNFVSGLILLFERPIKVGDQIKVAEYHGHLRRIGLRASILHTYEGADVIIPNAELISSKVVNWTMDTPQKRIEIALNVVSEAEPQAVLDLLARVAAEHPKILNQPAPEVVLVDFKDKAVHVQIQATTNESNARQVRSELLLALQRALGDAGWGIAA